LLHSKTSFALNVREAMAWLMSSLVLIGGSLPFDSVSKVFVNLFQLILIGGVGGDDVIGELLIAGVLDCDRRRVHLEM